jgi:hypothetical protein
MPGQTFEAETLSVSARSQTSSDRVFDTATGRMELRYKPTHVLTRENLTFKERAQAPR